MLGRLVLLIIFILFCFREFLFFSGSRQDDKRILILALALLVLVFGCQDVKTTGSGDVKVYYDTYEQAIENANVFSYIEDVPYMENGYLIITWLLARIFRWPQFILFFEAFFCFGITFRFIYNYSEDVLLSIMGFMSLGTMGFYQTAFRQSMAIAFCLLALEMADKKRWKTFLLFVLAAVSVHQTAIVFLPIYFIMKIKMNKLLVIVTTGIAFSIRLCAPFLFELGNKIFHRDFTMEYVGNKAGGAINILVGVFIVFSMAYQLGNYSIDFNMRYGQNENTDIEVQGFEKHKFLYPLILGMGLYLLRYQASIMERISFYFTPLMFILLPGVIQNGFSEKDGRMLKAFSAAGMLFLITWRFGTRDFLPFWLGP